MPLRHAAFIGVNAPASRRITNPNIHYYCQSSAAHHRRRGVVTAIGESVGISPQFRITVFNYGAR
jgi:threonine/homoserine/homoserine lactone efflux protein